MKWTRKLFVLLTCLCLLIGCGLTVNAQNDSEIVFTQTYDTVTVTVYSDGCARYEGIGTVTSEMLPWEYNVTSVEIGEGIAEIGYEAFRGTAIEAIDFPSSLRTIDTFAFYGCQNLTSVDLPEGLINIGSGAFFDAGLTSITIPDSVTSLAYDVPFGESVLGAFGYNDISEIKFGAGLKEIPFDCFGGNPLRTVEIPEGITRIDAYAFSFCKELSSVTIPASVEYIGGMAFVNTFSLTNAIFLGDTPEMLGPFFCASDNGVLFYPKENHTWENDIGSALGQSGGLLAAIPYTVDSQGNIMPEAPSADAVNNAISHFASQVYFEGSHYPDIYSYILNGNMLKVYGKEAFAFELSDACFGYLPISEKRAVSYDALLVGDILYTDSGVWVITEKTASGVELAGVQDGKVCYGVTMSKEKVQAADAYRTRVGVSPYPGEIDPALRAEKVTGPDHILTESEVYDLLISMQEQFPEGMPFSSKDHYHLNVTWYVEENVTVSQYGHGCSAFGGYLSDNAFGDLPARYTDFGNIDYDNIMVGDLLFTTGHEMVVMEVCSDKVIIAEGNYDGRIHWGREIPRDEIEQDYALVTRYPEAMADQLKNLASSDASAETIRDTVRNMDSEELTEALKTDSEAGDNLATLEEKVGGPAEVVVNTEIEGVTAEEVQIVGANFNDVEEGKIAALVIDAPEQSNEIPDECETKNAVHFSMTLENVVDAEELAVPVKITLPIPENLEPSRVAVVHYHGDQAEVLVPSIEVVGDKSYASIVVEGFSDFAMVQRKHTYTDEYDYKCDNCGEERVVDMTRPMVDMFRMYNPNTGEHFYTGSTEERDNLIAVGWQYEGVGFTFPLTTGKPVHRLFQPSTGEHLYTMDEAEKDRLMADGWNYEGIAFNSGFENEVPQYRLHNPNASVGAYHFTASEEERDTLLGLGWEYQGIGWYSLGAK